MIGLIYGIFRNFSMKKTRARMRWLQPSSKQESGFESMLYRLQIIFASYSFENAPIHFDAIEELALLRIVLAE